MINFVPWPTGCFLGPRQTPCDFYEGVNIMELMKSDHRKKVPRKSPGSHREKGLKMRKSLSNTQNNEKFFIIVRKEIRVQTAALSVIF